MRKNHKTRVHRPVTSSDSFLLVSTLLGCCDAWCHSATCLWEGVCVLFVTPFIRFHSLLMLSTLCQVAAHIPRQCLPKDNPVKLFSALPLARERMSQTRTMLSNETTRRRFGSGKLCEVMANYGNRGNSWKFVLHLRGYGRPFTSSISCRLFKFCRRTIKSRPGMTRSHQGCVGCIMLN